MNKGKLLDPKNNGIYTVYIIQQLIFILIISYIVYKEEIHNRIFSYMLLFSLELLYFAIMYGYTKYNQSLKKGLVYGFMELLLIVPPIIISFPSSCSKCYLSLIENGITLFVSYFILFSLVFIITILYLKFIQYINLKKLIWLFYILPPTLIALTWISSSGTGKLFGYFS